MCSFRWNLAYADAYAELLRGKHCSFAEKYCWSSAAEQGEY
jgi:hypothetical protein